MAGFTKVDVIWLNGKVVGWEDARMHVLAHGLQYGTGVFEGVRSYQTDDGPAVFRLDAHLARLHNSAALYEMEIPYSTEQLTEGTLDVIRRNQLGDAYIRPIAFFDAHSLSVWPQGCPVSVAIAAVPGSKYLASADKGVRVTVSSVRRFDSSVIPTAGKACGQYINSARAVQDALRRGYDEAILLNNRGEVAEGSGENIFLVQNGTLVTNDADACILMGITRDAILEIARSMNLPIVVRPITVEDLTTSDEVFFCGTAVEVTHVGEVDGHVVGDGTAGPLTRRLQQTFQDIVRGRVAQYRQWLTYVPQAVVTE